MASRSTMVARSVANVALRRTTATASRAVCAAVSRRAFSSQSAAMTKLTSNVTQELQYEKDNYEKPDAMSKLAKDWKFADTPGEVNLSIEKDVGADKLCKIEWQLVTPYNADMGDEEGGAEAAPEVEQEEETDFTITVSKKDGSSGMTFYCSTQQAEEHRFIIGNVQNWVSSTEKEAAAAYNGPEFEDLEDKLQEALDEYLGELGIDDSVFDFIDATAVDKEHREYMRWLDNMKTIMA